MLDLSELVINYIAVDKKGERKEFKILFLETLIANIGEYDENHFPDVSEYMSDVVDTTCGFFGPIYTITWYARLREESDIVEAIKTAVRDGNSTIVIEYLDALLPES